MSWLRSCPIPLLDTCVYLHVIRLLIHISEARIIDVYVLVGIRPPPPLTSSRHRVCSESIKLNDTHRTREARNSSSIMFHQSFQYIHPVASTTLLFFQPSEQTDSTRHGTGSIRFAYFDHIELWARSLVPSFLREMRLLLEGRPLTTANHVGPRRMFDVGTDSNP